MSGVTMRYNKTVYQLEKGLPPNGVVPKLKQRVDSMKDKVVIVLCVFHQHLMISVVIFSHRQYCHVTNAFHNLSGLCISSIPVSTSLCSISLSFFKGVPTSFQLLFFLLPFVLLP